MNTTAKYVIIVAGGSGSRMQSAIPKQFLLLKNLPILMHTINRFNEAGDIKIILVLPEHQKPYWDKLCSEYKFEIQYHIAFGGDTRFQSVKNGLALITEDALVAVHDGVRPLVSLSLINRIFDITATNGATIPATNLSESIRRVNDDTNTALNRDDYKLIQTPQCFNSAMLKKAYLQPYSALFTDDASVVEATGIKVHITEGEVWNIKITTKQDLVIAEALLSTLLEKDL